MKKVSIVLPVHNEAQNIDFVIQELLQCLEVFVSFFRFEVIVVDDGDDDLEILFKQSIEKYHLSKIKTSKKFYENKKDFSRAEQAKARKVSINKLKRENRFVSFKYIKLARKVGQGNATIAGLEESGGSWAITMDADGQDDPIFIIEMLKRLLEEENVDIILIQRPSEKKSVLYFLAAKLFYTQFSKNSGFEIPPGGGDYRLISRRVMDFVLSSRDPEPFLRGLVLYPSKNIVVINSQNYGANRRARNAGKSKYNFSKSFTVAMHGFLTFSTFPLKLVTKIGFILALVLPTIFIYAVFMRLLTNNWIPGGTLIIGLLVSLFGVNFIIQAIFAEYMRKSFKLAINRPRYIVERKWSYR